MKRLCVILLAASAMLANRTHFVINFDADDIRFSRVSGYDVVILPDLPTITEVGMPGLPVKTMHVALSSGQKAIGVKILDFEAETLAGTYRLLPVQPPQKTSDKENRILGPSGKYYSYALYPEKIAEIIGNGDVAGQALCAVRIYPLAYMPQSGTLILRKKIAIQIETEPAPPPKGIKLTPLTRSIYERELRELVANPEDVTVRSAAPMGTKLDPGDYEYVIITTSSLQSYWNQLLDWKKRKGINDTIVNVTWIYNNYSGSDNQEKIRNFVIDANSTWGTIWFLIGADANQIPMKVKQFYVDDWYDVPSDYYYADYDDDWYQEVFVGRAPADNYSQVNTFIGKVLKYEQDPPTTDYPLNVLLIGMDLDGSTQSENVKEYIDNYYIPSRFNVNKVYDSDGGNHKDSVLYYLNAGQNLVNHSDHSDWYLLGVGSTNHGWSLYSSDIDGLANTYKTCIFYSLGCWSNAFDYSDAISEHFIVYNPNEAGVAYIGNTRYGWYNPGNYNTLSMKMDKEWWRSLFSYDKYKIGLTLADSKNRNYPSDNTMKYVHYELCLLGDPEMPIWTNTPQPLTVSHPDTIAAWAGDYTVVVYSNGSPVDSAYVCLYKDSEVYERGYTNSSGQATFYINPTSEGVMYVTVTKHNYLPYQGESYVTSGPPVADFTANPTSGLLPLTVQFTDLSTGNITSWHWYFGDGEESFERNPNHTYTSEGLFDVTLIVSGPLGSDTMTKYSYIVIICNDALVPETLTVTAGSHRSGKVYAKTSAKTAAFQLEAWFDPSEIQVDSISWHETVFDTAWGGSGPQWFSPNIDNVNGFWQVFVVYDMSSPQQYFLNPMNNDPIVSVFYTIQSSVSPSDTLFVTMKDSLSENLFSDSSGQVEIHACLYSSPMYVIEEPQFIRGDANENGFINIADAVYIVNHLSPSPTFNCDDAADCDDSGNLNVADAAYLVNHLTPTPNLPAPCPDCGVDPTDDALGCGSFAPCGTMLDQFEFPDTAFIYVKTYENKGGDLSVDLTVKSPVSLAALQFEIEYNREQLHFLGGDFGMSLSDFDFLQIKEINNSIYGLGMYSFLPVNADNSGNLLKAGTHRVATLHFASGSPLTTLPIHLKQIVLANTEGNELATKVKEINSLDVESPDFAVFPPTPNPSRDEVHFQFILPSKSPVDLTIYNVTGQKIRSLLKSKILEAGLHTCKWDGKDEKGQRVPSGIYFYQLRNQADAYMGKLILTK